MPEFFFTTAKNNKARPSEYFRSVPVAGSLGADIHDIDLNTLSDAGQVHIVEQGVAAAFRYVMTVQQGEGWRALLK